MKPDNAAIGSIQKVWRHAHDTREMVAKAYADLLLAMHMRGMVKLDMDQLSLISRVGSRDFGKHDVVGDAFRLMQAVDEAVARAEIA